MCHVKETLMTLAHNACQARHSKRDYLGDYRAILRLFLRMRFRRLFELPHKGGYSLGWDASPILGPSSSSTSTFSWRHGIAVLHSFRAFTTVIGSLRDT